MKKKLIASAVSLAMALVMITSASFAWFTVSTAPEVTNIEVELKATENLEIAKGTTEGTAPGEVTADDHASETAYGANVTSFTKVTLDVPATCDSSKIQTVQYDANGRTNGLVECKADTIAAGQGVLYYDKDNSGAKNTGDLAAAADFLVWLRTNQTSGNLTAKVTCNNTKVKVYAKIGTACTAIGNTATPLGTVGAAGTALKTDVNTEVDLIVFFDGTQITAADVDTALDVSGIEVEFAIA